MKQPLLLLPGMLADGAFWRAQIEGLADIAAPQVIDYGLADSIETMADVALAAAPGRFALAGHSMGGRVAQEVVRRAPARVSHLALFCTDYRGPAQNSSDWNELEEIARRGGMPRLAETWTPHLIARARMADEDLVAAMVAMIGRQSPERLAAHIRAGRTRPDYSAVLPCIRCPTLVCAGELDAIRSVAAHEDMAARIPAARLLVLAGCGHMVAMEQPAAVTAAMREWLLTP